MIKSFRNRETATMDNLKFTPVHPGEILLEDFLEPMGISQEQLAQDIAVSARRIGEVIRGKRPIAADLSLRLSRYFGLSERFWLNLQARYDLEVEKDRLAERLESEVKVRSIGQMAPMPA